MHVSMMFSAIARYWYVVVVVTCLGVVLAGALASQPSTTFTAQTLVAVRPSTDLERLYTSNPDRYVQGEVLTISTRQVAQETADALGIGDTPRQWPTTTVQQVADSDLISIAATHADRDVAQAWAATMADIYVGDATARLGDTGIDPLPGIQARLEEADAELEAVTAQLEAVMAPYIDEQAQRVALGLNAPPIPAPDVVAPELTSRIEVLLTRVTDLERRERELAEGGPAAPVVARIVQQPNATRDPTGNPRATAIAGAALASLVLGIVLASGIFALRDRVSGTRDAERLLAHRFAQQVPLPRGGRSRWVDALEAPTRPVEHALARLAVLLETPPDHQGGLTVTLTSVNSDDDPAMLALMLGRHLAKTGREVVIADLSGLALMADRLDGALLDTQVVAEVGDLGEVVHNGLADGPSGLHLLSYLGEPPLSREAMRPVLARSTAAAQAVVSAGPGPVSLLVSGPLERSPAALELASTSEFLLLTVAAAEVSRQQLRSTGSVIAALDTAVLPVGV